MGDRAEYIYDCIMDVNPRDIVSHKSCEQMAFRKIYEHLQSILKDRGFLDLEDSHARVLCFTQPHVNVKGIRFTAWLISIILADAYGLKYLWSSDSDTVILPDTLHKTMHILESDSTFGCASTAMGIDNSSDSYSTQLQMVQFVSTVYAGSPPGAFGLSNVCSGAAAAFKIEALQEMLLPWYRQSIRDFKVVLIIRCPGYTNYSCLL